MNPPYQYEIQFDILGDSRREYDEWLATEFIEWVGQSGVVKFDAFYNETGLSPEVKFVLGFASLREWATFVNSDEHETAVAELKSITDGLDATIWDRGIVQLTGPATNDQVVPVLHATREENGT